MTPMAVRSKLPAASAGPLVAARAAAIRRRVARDMDMVSASRRIGTGGSANLKPCLPPLRVRRHQEGGASAMHRSIKRLIAAAVLLAPVGLGAQQATPEQQAREARLRNDPAGLAHYR